ncbi:GTPase HflX [Betaproteobacteria bacterium GR16-43]|nr:GTPase HflX [Betaproteobacteria bacterium GR16-43]
MTTRKTPDRAAPSGAEKRAPAVLVSLDFGGKVATGRAEEAARLVKTVGAEVVEIVHGKRDRPDPATFAGSGKVDQIRDVLRLHNSQTVVFDQPLSAVQVRNLERSLTEGWKATRVYDRTELILEIFAQRARSHEGKLQVELARLEHQSTRLIKGWSHLERQRGGLGKTGGPGEKQLELDRRLIGERVKKLKERIAKVVRTRETQRSGRQRSGILRVSLVGYTNAGKSTLFNRLTKGETYVADKLFATLDTTTRRLWLANDATAAISDTVGFIQDLPHALVAAFRATLEEAVQADLLLHVVDFADPLRDERIRAVNKVLKEIGAHHVPQIMVYNQIDRVPGLEAEIARDAHGKILNIKTSAVTGQGMDLLRTVLREAAVPVSADLAPAA